MRAIMGALLSPFEITRQVYGEIVEDRVMLIAAGTTYYFLLALFPGLAAFVALYGFFADPATVADQLAFLEDFTPAASLALVSDQLQQLAGQRTQVLSLTFASGLIVALWSVNVAIKALFEAMNIAYGEVERRGFFLRSLLSLVFTLGAMGIGVLLIMAVGIVPTILALVNVQGTPEILLKLARWPLLLAAVSAGITLVYRYGPSRPAAKRRWLTWGAGLSTLVWISASLGFSFYLENFADFNATYGALGAAVGLMVWVWISVVILIVGAELNAVLERRREQTAL